MKEFSPKPDIELGRYRHHKGDTYEVYDLTCDEPTGQWRVSYRALYEVPEGVPDRWSRTAQQFCEEVAVNGIKKLRFAKIDD